MEADTAKQIYTPHLKKVLRSFQASAHSSLHGPDSVMGLWSSGSGDKTSAETATTAAAAASSNVATSSSTSVRKSPENDPFTAPPPFPIQQPPIITPPDQRRCELSETVLENKTIASFTVGGEERLCFPDFWNLVLPNVSVNQVSFMRDHLRIFMPLCTSVQLDDLKSAGILPSETVSCSLITRSDAERLCAVFLDSDPPKADVKVPFVMKVYHECFGRCTGVYLPDLYRDPAAKCIECAECHGLFCPQTFVRHVHNHKQENRTCHWGFDSRNWRSYLLLHYDHENDPQMKELLKEMKVRYEESDRQLKELKEMKTRYDFSHEYAHKYKRKQILAEGSDPSKKVRVDNYCLYPPYPYVIDPGLLHWCANPAWSKVAASTPLPPVVLARDGKSLFIPPEALPHLMKDRPPYFLHDPSLLHSTGHVLPMIDGVRYETHYQANVAYNPSAAATLKKQEFKKDCMFDASSHQQPSWQAAPETVAKNPVLKKEHKPNSASCYLDSEDTFSDSSTLSGTDESVAQTLQDADSPSPPSVAEDLQRLASVLNEMGVDTSVCTEVISEVEVVIGRYRKCLKACMQKKKLVQMEFEKVHSKQRQKIHKLKEMNKCLERELLRLQVEAVRASEASRATSDYHEKVQHCRPVSTECPSSAACEDTAEGVVPVISKSRKISEKDSEEDDEIEVGDNATELSQPKERVNIKIEPVGK